MKEYVVWFKGVPEDYLFVMAPDEETAFKRGVRIWKTLYKPVVLSINERKKPSWRRE